MRRGLESVKPLDADVEKDGAKEIKYDKDSYDYLFSPEELLEMDEMSNKYQQIDEYDKAILDYIRVPSDGIAKAIAESEIKEKPRETPEELWDASDLGKYTIGTLTQEKQAAKSQDRNMEPVSKLEFQEISDDVDREDAELQAEYERLVQELEGIF